MNTAYKVIYDKTVDAIRTIGIELGVYTLSVTYNRKLDKIHMNFQTKEFLMPELQYLNNEFILVYNKLIIFQNDREEFEANYKRCQEFCNDYEELLKSITTKIRKDEPL